MLDILYGLALAGGTISGGFGNSEKEAVLKELIMCPVVLYCNIFSHVLPVPILPKWAVLGPRYTFLPP